MCLFWVTVVLTDVMFAEEMPSGVANNQGAATAVHDDDNAGNATQIDENITKDTRAIADQAIDQMIGILRGLGAQENIAALNAIREQFEIEDERECAAAVTAHSLQLATYLRERSELLAARKLMPLALQLASDLKKDHAELFVVAHITAAQLDEDFECYDSALNHCFVALTLAQQEDMAWRTSMVCRRNYAYNLRKLKRFDDAEKIYLELIEQAKGEVDGQPNDDHYNLQFALAALYAEKGAYREYGETLPNQEHERADFNGKRDLAKFVIMKTAFINYTVSIGTNAELAAEEAQKLADWTQEVYGVSSRKHIEAIELLANVRISQWRYDDAIALFKKSADLRARLLGEDHPSITRLYKDIDAVRKTSLDAAALPIGTPLVPSDSPVTLGR
jgi:hypothetical protein